MRLEISRTIHAALKQSPVEEASNSRIVERSMNDGGFALPPVADVRFALLPLGNTSIDCLRSRAVVLCKLDKFTISKPCNELVQSDLTIVGLGSSSY